MEIINATDGYKLGHHRMYMVYSNWTPRSNRYFPEAIEGSVVFGIQYFVKNLSENFNHVWFTNSYKDWDNLPENVTMFKVI